jgi:NADH:ubiquinone oxidoreductase subunit E
LKKITVEVCACNRCIMMGAMDIMESVESLKKLKTQLRLNTQVELIMDKKICGDLGDEVSPVVSINGEMMTRATPQSVMEQIIKIQRK